MPSAPLFFRFFLVVILYCSCCSFSAVPIDKVPPQKTAKASVKRQLRQQKYLQHQLVRQQTRASKRLQRPSKNHAFYNTVGFGLIIGSMIGFVVGVMALLAIFGFSAAANPFLYILAIVCATVFVVGGVFCLFGVIGSGKAERPKKGFGIAGLIIVGIPVLIALVGGFIALARAIGLLA